MNQTLTVNLPSDLYVRIKSRADETHRSVEDEAVELLAETVGTHAEPSFASLELLGDAAVEQAARSRLAADLASELELLHHKQQREGMTPVEASRCAELVRAYERTMLLRAYAAALLKKRGIDVSHLVVQP